MDEQQMLQQIVALVQAAMQGDQKATQQIQSIMLAAQQGDLQAAQIAQMIQTVAQLMQQGTPQMRLGAKIDYLKYLRGQCPKGYEMKIFKAGGKVCKKCMRKAEGGSVENKNTVETFKRNYKKCK